MLSGGLLNICPGNATRAGIILDFLDIKEISPGKAYWLLVTDEGKIIDTGSGTSSLTSQEYAIVLNSDWNLIGNPFNFPIEVGNVLNLS